MKTNQEYEIWIEIPVKVRVTHYTPGDPGRLSGPPENCYPPEPEEIAFEVIGELPSTASIENSEEVYDMVLQAHQNWLEDRE